MLADRLASKSDFDCQRELATMELLKLRFGEANLHGAEIMLGVSCCPTFLGSSSGGPVYILWKMSCLGPTLAQGLIV